MPSLASGQLPRIKNCLPFSGKIWGQVSPLSTLGLTRLTQGFKNSPTILGEVLAQDLQKCSAKDLGCDLFQYVDDLLLGHSTAVGSAEGMDALLRHLEDCGYKVSKKKAQICRQQVCYLGFTIPKGECSLGSKRKQVIWSLPEPKTRRQVKEFLGAVGFCRL